MLKTEAPPRAGEFIIDHMRSHVERSSTNRIHNHPYAELVIVDKGDIVYTAGGSLKHLGDKTVIYNPPHAIHNPFVQYSRLYERYKIKFYPGDLGLFESRSILDTPFAKEIDEAALDEIYISARGLFRESREGSAPIGEMERAALIYIMMRAANAEERTNGRENQYIDDVTEYISRHLSQKLVAEDIAAHHFVSKSKLNYDFKAYTNMTVNEYITLARVERAKELLASGRSVSRTAEECGFSTASYFIKVFSETTGTTPLKYQLTKVRKENDV